MYISTLPKPVAIGIVLTELYGHGLFWKKLLNVNHHLAKFCGHSHCDSGGIMVLVCHVISQHHVTRGWSYILGRNPSWQVTSLQSLLAIDTVGEIMELTPWRDIMI